METGELILVLVCHYGKGAINQRTRLRISSVSKRFRQIAWTAADQTVSDNQYTRALIFAWIKAIHEFMQDRISSRRGFEINHSLIASAIWPAKRIPRTCKKYFGLLYRLFQIVVYAEREHWFRARGEVILFYKCDLSFHTCMICPGCDDYSIEDAIECITRFAAHLERNGYKWSLEFNRDLCDQGMERVQIVQIGTHPKPAYPYNDGLKEYFFSREEEMELEYFRA